jgi:hypothetical protein
VAQNHQRPLALFSEMEMNAIRVDCLMRDAAGTLRIDRIRSANGLAGHRAESSNEFPSSHRLIPSFRPRLFTPQKSGLSARGTAVSFPA